MREKQKEQWQQKLQNQHSVAALLLLHPPTHCDSFCSRFGYPRLGGPLSVGQLPIVWQQQELP